MAAEQPFVLVGQTLTAIYFLYFLVVGPSIIFLEKLFWSEAPMGKVEIL
jgi:hypothetical protein